MRKDGRVGRQDRRRRRLKVLFGPADRPEERSAGFTEDVSAEGMFLQAGKIYPPRTRLFLHAEVDDQVVELTGRVVWAKKAPASLMGKKRCGMGIRLDHRSVELEAMSAATPVVRARRD